jgi:hypothetical protein
LTILQQEVSLPTEPFTQRVSSQSEAKFGNQNSKEDLQMKFPEHNSIPAWYKISSRHAGKGITLSVHRTALEEMMAIKWETAPFVPYLEKEYGLTDFTPPNEGDWGFNNAMKLAKSEDSSWVTWDIPFPVLKPKTREDPPSGVLAIRASLYIASTALSIFNGDTGWNTNQLIEIENICLPDKERSFGGGSLSATLTPDAVRWLKKQKHQEELLPVVAEMKAADEYMWPSNMDRMYRFRATCRQPKWINFTIPGNACDLSPDGCHDEKSDDGYKLVPHNVDSSLQQLTFLVGLAKLHDLMEGKV